MDNYYMNGDTHTCIQCQKEIMTLFYDMACIVAVEGQETDLCVNCAEFEYPNDIPDN